MATLQSSITPSTTRTQPNKWRASVAEVFTPPNLDHNRIHERRQTTSLQLQGIRSNWFLSGMRESNYALFHASLYPVFPALRLRIEAFLESHREVSKKWGPFAVTHIVDEIVFIAFERRDTWTTQATVVDWLAGFVELASGYQTDPSSKSKR